MAKTGGGGGMSQMQAMAAARDAMTQKLIDALGKAGDAFSGKGSGGGGSGSGGGSGAGSGSGPGPGPGPGSPGGRGGSIPPRGTEEDKARWMNAKVDSAKSKEVGESLFKAYSQSSGTLGASAITQAVGGAATQSMSLIGGLLAGAQPFASAAISGIQAGARGYGGAPQGDSDDMAMARGRQAFRRQERETDQTADDILVRAQAMPTDKYTERALRRQAAQRGDDRAIADINDPKARAIARTADTFDSFNKAGGLSGPSDDAAHTLEKAVMGLYYGQERKSQSAHTTLSRMIDELSQTPDLGR